MEAAAAVAAFSPVRWGLATSSVFRGTRGRGDEAWGVRTVYVGDPWDDLQHLRCRSPYHTRQP